MRRGIAIASWSVLIAPFASAQQPFPFSPGPRISLSGNPGASGSISLCVPIGDIDGDGNPDLVVSGTAQSGIHRGIDGKPIRFDDTTGLGVAYGARLARVGDADGDGFDDYAVGNPSFFTGAFNAGAVHIRSGRTGAILTTIASGALGSSFGNALDAIGDVDLDGYVDIVIGAPNQSLTANNLAEGAAFVYSVTGGSPLFSWTGVEPDDGMGSTVAGAGDVDLDGVPDVLVGGPSLGPGFAGEIRLCSGANGSVMLTHSDPAPGSSFGNAVVSPGDFDGDGIPDHAIAAHLATAGGLSQAGIVRFYSALSATPFMTIQGSAVNERMGSVLGGGGDVDGDGRGDLVVTSRTKNPSGSGFGRVTLYGSTTSSVVHSSQSTFTSFTYEFGARIVGDLDQDGVMEYAAGDTGFSLGTVAITSVCSGYAGRKGDGCPGLGGFEPRLRFAGCASPGGFVTLRVEESRGGAFGILLFGTPYGFSEAPAALNSSCLRYVKTLLPLQVSFTTTPGGAGQGTFSIAGNLPAAPLAAPIAIQAFLGDASAPGGFCASNGLYFDN